MQADLSTPLSPLQVELLKAFAMPTIDEADLLAIRKMLSQYFAKKASMQAQRLADERGLTANDIDAIAHQHHRFSGTQP